MEWLGNKYQMQNKCNVKGMQGLGFFFHFVGLLLLLIQSF